LEERESLVQVDLSVDSSNLVLIILIVLMIIQRISINYAILKMVDIMAHNKKV